MPQLFLANPRRRKARKAKAKARRKASPAQIAARERFAAMARARAGKSASAAPARRRKRRAASATPRRARRSGGASVSFSSLKHSLGGQLMQAGAGAVGAVAVDIAMGQAVKVLPESMRSRYTLDGGVNLPYYAAKAAIAVGLGVAGSKFLPGSARKYAALGAAGSLTVQAYELARAVMPADMLALAYYSPAPVSAAPANRPTGQNRVGYYARPALAASGGTSLSNQTSMAMANR